MARTKFDKTTIQIQELAYLRSMERVARAAMSFFDYHSVPKLERYLKAVRGIQYMEKEAALPNCPGYDQIIGGTNSGHKTC